MIDSKIRTREELITLRENFKKQGKTVGFTSGTFDILHPGHVGYLAEAKKLCDVLIVGCNSDSSVKLYKSEDRPITTEESRALVLSGLLSVDFVFIFEEKNNNKNIELLKPDFYIKAGDYSVSSLSSAPIVESYGGSVKLINFKSGFSTTNIIEKIRGSGELADETPSLEPAPILFLDRDGTIIEHIEYLHEPERVKIFPGALEAVLKFQEAGYRIAVVTNQPGIGLGYFTKEQFFAVNREIFKACRAVGVKISKFYYCPHTVASNSYFLKPQPGMIERGLKELNGIREKSVMVGDSQVDIDAGKNASLGRIVKIGQTNDKDIESISSLSMLKMV